jgi:ABC-type amino acid transport system permease subunit
MEFLDSVIDFLSRVEWMRVIITVLATLFAVVVGIYWPARLMETYTNQPVARYAWYFVGTMALIMIYLAMYGYGHFWDLYHESEKRENPAPVERTSSG